ncbi:MAG TPA: hydroxyacylglutathione hydrolase [Mariprofundaceae bacterium]|nr:hydroxyacylglutathione hydrolase [Mariprofundaceae bacterium]
MWTYQHQHFLVHQLPVLNDNYIYIIQDRHSPVVCVVDPALASPVIEVCAQLNIKPTHILNTHHHWDHTDGNKELVQTYQSKVVANLADASRIPHISQAIAADSQFQIGSLNIRSMDVPGHTLGHIAFVIDDALFCGDTLFGGGCGRLFEGSFAQMWQSLQKLALLDDNTKVYCAHEYTLPNLRFARDVDAGNKKLKQRIKDDTQTRMKQQPTIPSSIGLEKATNPFLRPLNAAFIQAYNLENKINLNAPEVFTHLRERKNTW